MPTKDNIKTLKPRPKPNAKRKAEDEAQENPATDNSEAHEEMIAAARAFNQMLRERYKRGEIDLL